MHVITVSLPLPPLFTTVYKQQLQQQQQQRSSKGCCLEMYIFFLPPSCGVFIEGLYLNIYFDFILNFDYIL